MTTLSRTPEGASMLEPKTHIQAWRARMLALPSAQEVAAEVAPSIGKPLEHARNWASTHRPKY